MVVCRTMLKRQSCCPRGLALASRTPHEGLGLGLDTSGLGLGLGLGLERKVLALALARLGKAKVKTLPPPHDPGHVVAVRVCSAHTHSVT